MARRSKKEAEWNRHGRIVWESRFECYVVRVGDSGFMASDSGVFGDIAKFNTAGEAARYARKYGYTV